VERDELVVTLRRRGRTQAQIARRLGMTQQGVAKALSESPKAGRAATCEPEP
jgi:transcriptional regulator